MGLGIEEDAPGPGAAAALPDGIHLRWLFKHDRGFPWYGYYLLRRQTDSQWRAGFDLKPTIGNELEKLIESFARSSRGGAYVPLFPPQPTVTVGAAGAKASDFFYRIGTAEQRQGGTTLPIDTLLIATEVVQGQVPPAIFEAFFGLVVPTQLSAIARYDLYGLKLDQPNRLELRAPQPDRYRRVRLQIGFLRGGSAFTVNVSALHAGEVIQQASVTGKAGNVKDVVIESDYQPFTSVMCSRADAVVLNVEVVFALGSKAWELVNTLKPVHTQPIRLPITHPDYPAGAAPENPDAARRMAEQRAFATIGTSFPSRLPAQTMSAQGTVDVVAGSPVVRGSGTNWTDAIAGLVLQTRPDDIPHTILHVLSPDRLVLARAYAGSSDSQVSYSLSPDPFGQLYDALIQLVEGGPDSVPMGDRLLRLNYQPQGTVSLQAGTTRVIGQGINWFTSLAGLQIHFLLAQGKLQYMPGSNIVQRVETTSANPINSSLAGAVFSELIGSQLEIDGHPQPYVVTGAISDRFLMIHPSTPKQKDADSARWLSSGFRILERQSYQIDRVESVSLMHLTEPYRGRARVANCFIRIADSDLATSKVSGQRLLDVVTLGSFAPRIAQTLGLHVVDHPRKANSDGTLLAYDYLLIADHQGFFQTQSVVAWVNSEAGRSQMLGDAAHESAIDIAITYDHAIKPAAPLAPPDKPQAYSLSDASRLTSRTGQPHELPLKALTGLTWNATSRLPSEAPVLYHVWRQLLTESDTLSVDQPHNSDSYQQLTGPDRAARPVMLTQTPSTVELPAKPSDWPHGLRYFDMVSRYGWYSYRLSGVDLFGRHSSLSEPAAWWSFMGGSIGSSPFDPLPVERHPFAVQIVDETAPPPPTDVEAHALDPADPYLERNTATIAWRSALPPGSRDDLIGLRVRWRWTQAHIQQAPGTTHFQICYHPHRLNVLVGNITQVDADDSDHVLVTTNLSLSGAARSLEGSHLRIGQQAYRIVPWVRSQNNPLRLRLATLGTDRLRPAVGAAFSLKLTRQNGRLYTDYAETEAWTHSNFHRMPVEAFVGESLQPRRDATGQPLSGNNGTLQGFLTLPLAVDLSTVRPGADYVYLPDAAGAKYYRIVQILPAVPPLQGHHLWLVGRPQITVTAVRWTIGVYERIYEVLLPEASETSRFDLQLDPSATDPVAYGHVGVTAHDAKGRGSPVSTPAKVYRVHRTPPDAPPPPNLADDNNIYASPADYYGHSYYTVEWAVKAGHSAHVFRALDDAVLKRDRAIRITRTRLDPANPKHQRYFPQSLDATRQAAIAQQLNAITQPADYTEIALDALPVLLRLPGNEAIVAPDETALQARRDELVAHDWHLRQTHGQLAPNDDAIPQVWSLADRQAIAATLNAIDPAAADAYQGLSNRALQTVASLPGHTAAFTQITAQVVTAPVGTYRDRLNGKSRNRFFYRVAYVDAGQNRSSLSLSTPPIYLPKVTPPATPVITRAFAGHPDETVEGDRMITLQWVRSREPDLDHYRVYRTDKAEKARDIRLMHLVDSSVYPDDMSSVLSWTNTKTMPQRKYYYRLVAIDSFENVSQASNVVSAQSVEVLPPPPPLWQDSTRIDNTKIHLQWICQEPLLCMVKRSSADSELELPTSPWLDPIEQTDDGWRYEYVDNAKSESSYTYRITVRSITGYVVNSNEVIA